MLTLLRGDIPQRYSLDYRLTIQQNIAAHLDSGHSCHLVINRELITDPATDARLQRVAEPDDDILVIHRPEGFDPISWVYIAVAAVVAAVAIVALMPKPQIPNGAGVGKDSPNNRLTGQTNIARAYQALPDVYGQVRCYPDLIQQSTTEYSSNQKLVTEWLCISRGVGTIADVRYSETPLSQVSGASYTVFTPAGGIYPEQGTTTAIDVFETFASDDINGQVLVPSSPYNDPQSESTTLDLTPGTDDFSFTLPDGPEWDDLKALFPGGTITNMNFAYEYSTDGNPPWLPTSYSGNAGCVSYSETSPGVITYVCTRTGNFEAFSREANPTTISFDLTRRTFFPLGPTTLPADGSQIWFNTIFPRGLVGTVLVRAEWWQIDAGGGELPGTRQSQVFSYSASTYDAQYRTEKITPSAGYGRYRIQFQRNNDQIDDGLYDQTKLEEVYAVRYFPTKSLPGITLIKIQTQATIEATGLKERKFNLLFTRHVRQFNGAQVSASRNFARAVYHQYTVVAARSDTELDLPALQAINDTHGEDSELLRFDYTFDDLDISLGQRIQTTCNAARVIESRVGQQWTFTRDEDKGTNPEWQFDYRNLSASGESVSTLKGQLPNSYDGVQLEWVDPTNNKKAYVRLRIEADGDIVTGVALHPYEVQLAGCRTLSQATNRAYFEAARIKYQRRAVRDTALQDALIIERGALVRWVDPHDIYADDGLAGGEVIGVDGLSIETDTVIPWGSFASARVMFTNDQGSTSSSIVATPRTDGKNGFILAAFPSTGIYVRNGVVRQLGSRFSIAFGLTQAEVESAGLYLLTNKKPNADGTVEIELAQYDRRMYQYD